MKGNNWSKWTYDILPEGFQGKDSVTNYPSLSCIHFTYYSRFLLQDYFFGLHCKKQLHQEFVFNSSIAKLLCIGSSLNYIFE